MVSWYFRVEMVSLSLRESEKRGLKTVMIFLG